LSCVSRCEELIRQEAWRDNSMLHEAQFCKSASGASEAPGADVVLADVCKYRMAVLTLYNACSISMN